MPYEVIERALEKTADNNGNWKYCKTILNKWLEKGIITIDGVNAEELEYKQNKQPKVETEEERKARRVRELEEALKNDNK